MVHLLYAMTIRALVSPCRLSVMQLVGYSAINTLWEHFWVIRERGIAAASSPYILPEVLGYLTGDVTQ